MDPRLRYLTIKPFHGCSHNCPYCDSRQELFRASREATLGVEAWARVFRDADDLGTEYLDISGGEPTMYKGLTSLIWEAKRLGWYTSINSTGFRVAELLDELVCVCLDQVIVSLVSTHETQHDRIRHTPGSWREAIRAIERVSESPMRLILHFIISRSNFRELPELIDFAFSRRVNGIALVYPENDGDAHNLMMSGPEIREFRDEVLPLALRRYADYRPRSDQSHANLADLFAAHGDEGDFSTGQYWFDFNMIKRQCDKPATFALIYANGNVLPCNAVEYTHTPIVGNVLNQSLKHIWHGAAYEAFRQHRMAFCHRCPIKRHTGAAITTVDNPPYAAPVVRCVPERLPATRPAIPPGHLTTRIPRHANMPASALVKIS